MHPNANTFLRSFLHFSLLMAGIAVVVLGVWFGGGYLVDAFGISRSRVSDFLTIGLVIILATPVIVFLYVQLFRDMWTDHIMVRMEKLDQVSLDKTGQGIQVTGQHYHSGGEDGDPFWTIHKYYIRFSDARMFAARIYESQDKKELHARLSKSTGLPNHDDYPFPEISQSPFSLNREDGYTVLCFNNGVSSVNYRFNPIRNKDDDSNKRPYFRVIPLEDQFILVRRFHTWFDYGFEVSCYDNQTGARKWRRKV